MHHLFFLVVQCTYAYDQCQVKPLQSFFSTLPYQFSAVVFIEFALRERASIAGDINNIDSRDDLFK
jgi:hypothetical protein